MDSELDEIRNLFQQLRGALSWLLSQLQRGRDSPMGWLQHNKVMSRAAATERGIMGSSIPSLTVRTWKAWASKVK